MCQFEKRRPALFCKAQQVMPAMTKQDIVWLQMRAFDWLFTYPVYGVEFRTSLLSPDPAKEKIIAHAYRTASLASQ